MQRALGYWSSAFAQPETNMNTSMVSFFSLEKLLSTKREIFPYQKGQILLSFNGLCVQCVTINIFQSSYWMDILNTLIFIICKELILSNKKP